ncbi:MAG: hypothetical protein ACTSX4_06625 [Candidatus Helarchaeota archaeon]
MPCFFMRKKIKRTLDSLKIKNKERLNQLLLERYTDEELHEMSDEELIYLIRKIHEENKEELEEEILMMYA